MEEVDRPELANRETP
jgi:SP family arabinose:H+ symporter-like MFS transporter